VSANPNNLEGPTNEFKRYRMIRDSAEPFIGNISCPERRWSPFIGIQERWKVYGPSFPKKADGRASRAGLRYPYHHDIFMDRIFDNERVWSLSTQRFQRASELLIRFIGQQWDVKHVVGIRRGGELPAQYLSSKLGVPLSQVTAVRNKTDAIMSDAITDTKVTSLSPPYRLSSITVIVDDICGTGDTLAAVTASLSRHSPTTTFRTVTLCRNAAATTYPDLWLWTVRDWVIFPWEEIPPGICCEPLPLPTAVCTLQP
jgi:hypoxanthine phosphoribosyltransferase